MPASNLSDVRPLSSLVSLHKLDLSECRELFELRPLSALVSLKRLDVSVCSRLSDLGARSGLVGLQTLNLRYCMLLHDVRPLSALLGLRSLDLSNCMVTDVRPLSELVGLRTLSLADCKGLTNVQPLGCSCRAVRPQAGPRRLLQRSRRSASQLVQVRIVPLMIASEQVGCKVIETTCESILNAIRWRTGEDCMYARLLCCTTGTPHLLVTW